MERCFLQYEVTHKNCEKFILTAIYRCIMAVHTMNKSNDGEIFAGTNRCSDLTFKCRQCEITLLAHDCKLEEAYDAQFD